MDAAESSAASKSWLLKAHLRYFPIFSGVFISPTSDKICATS